MTIHKIYAYLILIGTVTVTSSSYLFPVQQTQQDEVQDMDISGDEYDSEVEEVLAEMNNPQPLAEAYAVERYYGQSDPNRNALANTLFHHLACEQPNYADFLTHTPLTQEQITHMPQQNSIEHLADLLDRQELRLDNGYPDPDLRHCTLTEALINYVEPLATPGQFAADFFSNLRDAIQIYRSNHNQHNQG